MKVDLSFNGIKKVVDKENVFDKLKILQNPKTSLSKIKEIIETDNIVLHKIALNHVNADYALKAKILARCNLHLIKSIIANHKDHEKSIVSSALMLNMLIEEFVWTYR